MRRGPRCQAIRLPRRAVETGPEVPRAFGDPPDAARELLPAAGEPAQAAFESAAEHVQAMELFAGGFELVGDDRRLFGLPAKRGVVAGRGFEFARQPAGTLEPAGAEVGQQRAQALVEIEGEAGRLALAAREPLGAAGGTVERGAGSFSPRRGAAEPGGERCGALPSAGRAFSQQAAAGGRLREPAPEAPDPSRGAA